MRIDLLDIHKHYGPIKANDGIDLRLEAGAIHGLLGENGAGKSTLMKVLAGFTRPTAGQILIDGAPVTLQTPSQAVRRGIGMLYQEPLDYPAMSVLSNYMIGQSRGLRLRRARHKERLGALCRTFGFAMDPQTPVRRLTIGERQQLEMVRLLALGIQVLILDEPTTGISEVQKRQLFEALKKLAAEGKIIVLVSHKLEDVESLCTRTTVLRDGRVCGGMRAPFVTARLLEMMFGTPPPPPTRRARAPMEPLLEMRAVEASGGRSGLRNCDVVIRHGEVVGLAGLEGSGQAVFLRVAAGLQRPSAGAVILEGVEQSKTTYHDRRRRGLNFLPSDRLAEGLIAALTITEHVALRDEYRSWWIPWQRCRAAAQRDMDAFRIKGYPALPVEALSGGNQQRLLLALLPPDPLLLLLEQPTRGLDVDSVNWVWAHLHRIRSERTSIVFASAEIDEILLVADRVLVFFEGAIVMDVAADQTDMEQLGRAVAGKN